MSTTNTVEDFSYVNLQEIDPAYSTLPTAVYTLQLQKASVKSFTYKNGDKAGQTGSFASFQFVVLDDPEFSGRKLFDSKFPSQGTLKDLRRLMDATGIVQEAGEDLGEWLGRVANESPKVKILVIQKEDLDKNGNPKSLDFQGKPAKVNVLNWREVQPA